jgi:hypothetical protein
MNVIFNPATLEDKSDVTYDVLEALKVRDIDITTSVNNHGKTVLLDRLNLLLDRYSSTPDSHEARSELKMEIRNTVTELVHSKVLRPVGTYPSRVDYI